MVQGEQRLFLKLTNNKLEALHVFQQNVHAKVATVTKGVKTFNDVATHPKSPLIGYPIMVVVAYQYSKIVNADQFREQGKVALRNELQLRAEQAAKDKKIADQKAQEANQRKRLVELTAKKS